MNDTASDLVIWVFVFGFFIFVSHIFFLTDKWSLITVTRFIVPVPYNNKHMLSQEYLGKQMARPSLSSKGFSVAIQISVFSGFIKISDQ